MSVTLLVLLWSPIYIQQVALTVQLLVVDTNTAVKTWYSINAHVRSQQGHVTQNSSQADKEM